MANAYFMEITAAPCVADDAGAAVFQYGRVSASQTRS